MHHLDPRLPQSVGWPDAGELEQTRRPDRAATYDHLAVGVEGFRPRVRRDGHPDRAAILNLDLERLRVEPDREVLSVSYGLDEGARRRRPLGVARRELIVAYPILNGAIEIVIERDSEFLCGEQERVADRRRIDRIGHAERAAVVVIGVVQLLIVLAALEIRQHLAIAPTRRARLARPIVIIPGVAARVELRVDRGAA